MKMVTMKKQVRMLVAAGPVFYCLPTTRQPLVAG